MEQKPLASTNGGGRDASDEHSSPPRRSKNPHSSLRPVIIVVIAVVCIIISSWWSLRLPSLTTRDCFGLKSSQPIIRTISMEQTVAEPAECLLHLTGCNLSCLDWTIVLATGRSGSTTIQQMISKLPGMNFYGEEGGLLMSSFHTLQETISQNRQKHGHNLSVSRTLYLNCIYLEHRNFIHLLPCPHVQWLGSKDNNISTVACMTQKFYAERHGASCLHRGCKHGWKEIRYMTPKAIEWIRTIFPSSKIVLNYRSSCSDNYKDSWNRNCSKILEQTQSLVNATRELTNVFRMDFEQINNLTKWQQLSKFIGYDKCKAMNLTVANMNHSSTPPSEEAAYSPWTC